MYKTCFSLKGWLSWGFSGLHIPLLVVTPPASHLRLGADILGGLAGSQAGGCHRCASPSGVPPGDCGLADHGYAAHSWFEDTQSLALLVTRHHTQERLSSAFIVTQLNCVASENTAPGEVKNVPLWSPIVAHTGVRIPTTGAVEGRSEIGSWRENTQAGKT